MDLFRIVLFAAAATLIAACSDGGSPTPTPPPATPTATPPTPPPPPSSTTVTISGAVTFDLVPFNVGTSGLDFDAITQAPARGIVVQALDSGGGILDTDVTNNSGQYSVSVSSNTDIRIRARARLMETSIATWDVTVRDNTNGDADYVLDGTLTSSGAANSTRNLNADSGWGGTSYTGVRAAAPFAILDVIFNAKMLINNAAPGTNFPTLQVYWSPNNRAASGNISDGDIGTTSYSRIGGGLPTILVLGNANNDTDEFDRHVMAHEYGHYVEDQFGRTDNIGGAHSITERLDPRVAMSEGWGNAFSAMVEDDPIYRDSSGAMQASGFSFSVETNGVGTIGWFSEASVQSVIYDLFDSNDDGVDTISAGFTPIFETITDPAYINNSAATTIFSFLNSFRAISSVSDSDIDALVVGQNINGTDSFGAGEINNGGNAFVLPVFKTLTVGGAPVMICSVDDAGTFNKLGNYDFVRLSIATTGTYTLTMTRVSGPTGRDPDFFVHQAGNLIDIADSTSVDAESLTRNLPAADYWISAFDFFNIDATAGTAGDVCYNFTAI